MLESGFIKLHRKILKWEWYDEPNTMRLFIHLLLTASIEDESWHGVDIKRGSRVSSYSKLAKELHLTIKEIRTASQHLEQTGEVARTAYPKFTVFSISNYDNYQMKGTKKGTQKGTESGNQGASKGQQYKKDKESQEDKEESATTSGAAAPSSAAPEKTIWERMRE